MDTHSRDFFITRIGATSRRLVELEGFDVQLVGVYTCNSKCGK